MQGALQMRSRIHNIFTCQCSDSCALCCKLKTNIILAICLFAKNWCLSLLLSFFLSFFLSFLLSFFLSYFLSFFLFFFLSFLFLSFSLSYLLSIFFCLPICKFANIQQHRNFVQSRQSSCLSTTLLFCRHQISA